jgi:TonB family protein
MKAPNSRKLLLLLFTLVLALSAAAQTGSKYESVSLVTAGDVAYPPQARSSGMVTLDVTVDSSGAVQSVQAVRDVPPLTKPAEDAVRQWKFHPATEGDQSVPGVIRVNVVFNPFNPSDVSIPNKPLPPPENASANVTGAFQPPDVKSADYAVYPPNTVASGAVILNVQISEDGSVHDVNTVRGVDPLASASSKAVREWQFTPGVYESKPVASHEIVAFVFVRPEIGTM